MNSRTASDDTGAPGREETELAEAKDKIHYTENRAVAAEQRAIEANASIERIVQAIQTQLPVASI